MPKKEAMERTERDSKWFRGVECLNKKKYSYLTMIKPRARKLVIKIATIIFN